MLISQNNFTKECCYKCLNDNGQSSVNTTNNSDNDEIILDTNINDDNEDKFQKKYNYSEETLDSIAYFKGITVPREEIAQYVDQIHEILKNGSKKDKKGIKNLLQNLSSTDIACITQTYEYAHHAFLIDDILGFIHLGYEKDLVKFFAKACLDTAVNGNEFDKFAAMHILEFTPNFMKYSGMKEIREDETMEIASASMVMGIRG